MDQNKICELNKECEINKINNIKILMIYCVVFGHFIGRQVDYNLLARSLYKIIYMFHMPVFVIISGYLYSKSKRKSLIHVVNSTLVPYCIFQVAYVILKVITKEIININKAFIEIFIPGSVHWYILCLFYWKLIINKINHNIRNLTILCIIPLLSGAVPFIGEEFALAKALNYFIYFYIGYLIYENKKSLIISKNRTYLLFVIAMSIFIIFYKDITIPQITVVNSYSEMGLDILKGILSRLIIYISSLGFSLFIILKISNKKYRFTYLGSRTLGIYFLHNYFVYLLLITKGYEKILDWRLGIIITLTISLLVCFILGSKIVFMSINKILSIFEINENILRYIKGGDINE